MSVTAPSPYMTEVEASEYLGIPKGTLRNWRSSQPDRLPSVKRGRMVRYPREVVEQYFEKNERPAGATAGQNTNPLEGNHV